MSGEYIRIHGNLQCEEFWKTENLQLIQRDKDTWSNSGKNNWEKELLQSFQ
jgi:hypothetical protein